MARIKTYTTDNLLSDTDKIIGTDTDSFDQTKNYSLFDLRQYLLSGLEPVVGGNLKITTINATSEEHLTPEDYVNNLDPAIQVLQYEIVFLILNGTTYIFRKNDNIFGIGESQTLSSDFTEIDVTSQIDNNLQDLNSVLNEGNISNLDVLIGELYLKNNHVYSGGGYVNLNGNKNKLNILDNNLELICEILKDNIILAEQGTAFNFNIEKPSISQNRTATLQDNSGTIAYLSDIPTIPVTDVVAGDNIVVDETTPGVFEVSAIVNAYPRVIQTRLLDSLTDTVFYSNGGIFIYNEDTAPLDTISLKFSEDIYVEDEELNIIGYIHVQYENGANDSFAVTGITIEADKINIPVPFPEFYVDTVGERVSVMEVCIYPSMVFSVSTNNPFDGTIASSIAKYFRTL